jgi:hypothetical protein
MRTINISKVHFEMLQEIAKRQRVKPAAVVEEMIQMQYGKK